MGEEDSKQVMRHYQPDIILIERAVEHSLITRNVRNRLPGLPTRLIDSIDNLPRLAQQRNPAIPRGKKQLVLARHKGKFFKPCPASQSKEGSSNLCCNYFVINYASNCHMECSYCYLQSYLNSPHLTVYANYDELLSELAAVFRKNPDHPFRIGTGELADSLALDPLTAYTTPLVEFFALQKNAVLELKTKSDCVDNLLELAHGGRTVVAWSLNPPFIQATEEHGTATIAARLEAARRCVEAGYRVAFHLDPLIHYSGWEQGYAQLVEQVFECLPHDSLAWISIGSLRLTGGLKQVMRRRFPGSPLPLGELVPGPDGKLRYFKPIRVAMYRSVVEQIRRRHASLPIYACMESAQVWMKVFQQAPREEEVGQQVLTSILGAG